MECWVPHLELPPEDIAAGAGALVRSAALLPRGFVRRTYHAALGGR